MKTVALMGAGAVGAYFIQGFCEKMGDDFFLVAEGERKTRLERDGVDINGTIYKPLVKTPAEAHGADYLLIATKYTALKSSLQAIKEVVAEHTTVLSLLNGVDSEEVVGEAIGMEHMVHSFMKISSMNVERKIVFDVEQTKGVYLGVPGEKTPSKRVQDFLDLFVGTNLKYVYCEDILSDLWRKYALNICKNLPQAVIGAGVGCYFDSAHMEYISKKMRDEVHAVAAAKGIFIKEEEYLYPRGFEKEWARYSTLQDIDAGRHTEVDIFSGHLVELGKQLSVPTPYNDMCYHFIKALEEKNDGLFDYKK